jgi:hypothetical protein
MLLLYRLCVAETKGGNRPFARVKIMLRILRKIFFNVEGWGGGTPPNIDFTGYPGVPV